MQSYVALRINRVLFPFTSHLLLRNYDTKYRQPLPFYTIDARTHARTHMTHTYLYEKTWLPPSVALMPACVGRMRDPSAI